MDQKNTNLETVKIVPNNDRIDNAHSAAKIILSLVPGGGTVAEIINKGVSTVTNARVTKWQEAVANSVEELFIKLQDLPETMVTDDRFVNAYLQGSIIAARTHRAEKLEALKNAVLNSSLPKSPDENLQEIFINLIDFFTPLNLSILKVYYDNQLAMRKSKVKRPGLTQSAHLTQPYTVLEQSFPEYKDKKFIFDQAIQELRIRGLLDWNESEPQIVGNHVFSSSPSSPHITELGKLFIKYINSPLEEIWEEPPIIRVRGKVIKQLNSPVGEYHYQLEKTLLLSEDDYISDIIFSLYSPEQVKIGTNLEFEFYKPEKLGDIIYPFSTLYLDNINMHH